MASYLHTRKSIFLHIALLFLIVIVWTISYMQPVLRSFFKEEHLFYGKVSYAAIPSVFGGSNIPFLDKTYFRINGDDKATFVLYTSKEINDEMADWFSFAAVNVEDVPLEISAVRISENKFIVKSLSNEEGELDWDTVSEYQLYYSLLGLGLVGVCTVGFIVFLVLGIRCKR